MRQNIRCVRVGDLITERRKEKEKEWMFVERTKTFRVVAVYPHLVLTIEEDTGNMRSFCYGDLIIMNLEKQSPKLEALKITL